MKKKLSQNNLTELYNSEINKKNRNLYKQDLVQKKEIGNKSISKKSIFLSHSHLDKTIVLKIGLVFEKLKAELYIDWMDKSLPEYTSDITATEIKNRIIETDRFLFLATYHGLRSKWCNWELGIADAGNNKMAILPIKTKTGKWKGSEYLKLYPEMQFDIDDLENISINDITIKKINGEILSFEEWMFN